MTTTPRFACFFLLSVFLLTGASGLWAQNSLTPSPGAVFLFSAVGGSPQQQAVSVSSSPLPVPVTASVLGANTPWLTVSQSGSNTPTTVTVTATAGALPQGVYSGTIQLSSPSAGPVQVPVVLTVASASPLSSSTPSLLFIYVQGTTTLPAPQSVTISAATPQTFSMVSNASWLLAPSGGATPAIVSIGVNPTGLTPGYYTAFVQATPTAGGNPLFIPVLLVIASNPLLSATPASLSFYYQIGGINPNIQKTISLANPGGPIPFSASASVAPAVPQWLSVSPTSGTTPGTLTVTVTPGALPPGTYQGKVTIASAAAANPSQDIPVTLTVSTQQLLDLSTNSLSFTFQSGGPFPAAQTIIPTSTGQPMTYAVTTTTANNVPWLVATATGITPTPITVTVSPQGLPTGVYTGTVSINAQNALGAAANNPQIVNVTLAVTSTPTLSANPSALVFNYQIGQPVPGPQTVAVSSTGGPVTFTVTPSVNQTANNINWLLTSTPTGQPTPTVFSASVSPVGLPPGTYTGTITLIAPSTSSGTTVPVTMNVSNNPLLNVNPQALSFSTQVGATTVPVQVATVTSTSEPVPYTVSVPANVGFISIGNPSPPVASATQPSTFFVAVLPANLTSGTYTTIITVHPTNGAPDVAIPVIVTVSAGNLSVTPASLNFTQVSNAAAPASQTVNVTSTGTAPLTFNAFVTGASWLTITQSATTTPATLTVSVNGISLQPGNFKGTINIVSASAGNSPQTIDVNLTVAPPQNLVLQPAALTFTSQFMSPAPPPQTLAVSASTGTLPFTVTVSLASGQTWLTANPASGTAGSTPANLSVTVTPGNLQPGTYTGSITITSPQASNSPQTVSVTYIVTAIPTPVPLSIVNAASGVPSGVAPGEIIAIKGTNLGPVIEATATFDASGMYPTTLSDTRVLFDGIPGSLLYVVAGQINVVVPYEMAGRASVNMVVQYKNTPSGSISLRVTDSSPGIFLFNLAGQAAALNQNLTLNSPANPARKDLDTQNIVVIYATGEGSTSPAGVTGLRIPADGSVLKHPILPVSVTFGGKQGEVLYAGSAPSLISGVFQLNVRIPADAPTGSAVPVVVTVGQNSSQGLATIAIQ